jgi:hypothetical protein
MCGFLKIIAMQGIEPMLDRLSTTELYPAQPLRWVVYKYFFHFWNLRIPKSVTWHLVAMPSSGNECCVLRWWKELKGQAPVSILT